MTIARERRIAETRHYTRWKALSIPRFLICNTYKSAGKHRRYLKKKDFSAYFLAFPSLKKFANRFIRRLTGLLSRQKLKKVF